MGRKKTQPDDKYLKRRRYYLKSKGYSDEEIDVLLNKTSKELEFKGFFNDIDLVNNFNKTLLNLNEGSVNTENTDNSQETLESNEEFDETNTNDKTFTNTNTNANTNDNVFVNDNVNDNVKFEFDETLKSEDTNFTQQEQPTEQKKDIAESSVSGKMFMLTVNILLTSASKFIKKDITLDEQEVNEFAKLYDEAYPDGLPVNPKIVFWGGLAMTITTKALKK